MSMRTNTKLSLAAVLAGSAALLSACGGSSGLIPAGNAGPLRSDFEKVAEAAESGNGNCASTETAIARTERDFASLPSSVDARLRTRLSEGIEHLASQARVACRQPSGGGTATTGTATESSTTSKTSSTSTSTTTTTTYTTASEEPEVPSSATSTTSSTPAGPVGGAEAPTGGAEANPGGSPAEEGEQR
jgi:hypothetical protein